MVVQSCSNDLNPLRGTETPTVMVVLGMVQRSNDLNPLRGTEIAEEARALDGQGVQTHRIPFAGLKQRHHLRSPFLLSRPPAATKNGSTNLHESTPIASEVLAKIRVDSWIVSGTVPHARGSRKCRRVIPCRGPKPQPRRQWSAPMGRGRPLLGQARLLRAGQHALGWRLGPVRQRHGPAALRRMGEAR